MKFLSIACALIGILVFSCSGQKDEEPLKIGFGKADLSRACILEDPVSDAISQDFRDKYRREEKFAISDRVEGRWRPGSGGTRKLVDSLFVTAMYGEDENGPWIILTLDQMILNYGDVDVMMHPLTHELGIPKERIVLLPSHSHATPPLDPGILSEVVLEAATRARDDRVGVEIAFLNLQLDGKKYLINRRVYVDGIGSRTVMFNDGCEVYDDHLDASAHIRDWIVNLGTDPERFCGDGQRYVADGGVDSALQALFIRDRQTGKLKGSFTRFAAHSVIVSSKVVNGDVSGDFTGYLKKRLEEKLGGVALFGQGPSGDLRPLNKEYSHAFAKSYGQKLADLLVADYGNLEWQALTSQKFFTQAVEMELLDGILLSTEQVEKEMVALEAAFDRETDPEKRRQLQNRFWGLYRTPANHRMVRPEWKQEGALGLQLYALKLNDQVLLAAQGEVFHEIGAKMLEPFRDHHPVLVTIANEYISYLPTDEERLRGGYEPSVCIVVPGSPDTLIKASHRLLERIYGE
ncbi:MAG: hypothetical protein CSA96_02300 [Bacteroidetes bacterium]|nr:MAG: hypothetical protein CSA96_02300 [Bacteroidota bacterium]